MELEFMELEFHLKRHYRALKNCMELEFIELKFQQFFYFILIFSLL